MKYVVALVWLSEIRVVIVLDVTREVRRCSCTTQ